ncbi:hypothetical protein GC175_27955 [bacterium]|nr:hypothetical protein [bacterium]
MPTPTWTPEWTPTETPVIMETPANAENVAAAPASEAPLSSPATQDNSPLPTAQVVLGSSEMTDTESAPNGAESVAVTETESTSPTTLSLAAAQPARSEFAPSPPTPNRFVGMRIALFTVIVVSVVAALAFLLGFTALFGNDKQRKG